MTKVLLVRLALSLTLLVGIAAACRSETVDVKYRGPVDLAPFMCEAIERSSFIQRVCYDHWFASQASRTLTILPSDQSRSVTPAVVASLRWGSTQHSPLDHPKCELQYRNPHKQSFPCDASAHLGNWLDSAPHILGT
jgi:hypothetical protein